MPLIVISILAVVCVVLSVLLFLNTSQQEAATQDEWNVPPQQQGVYNADSAMLADLRDSLRNASPVVSGASGGLTAAVYLEKMNVFYIGVDNPLTISVGGVPAGDLQPSITGGTMRSSGKPGSYIVTVSSGTQATINVAAKVNGATTTVGSYQYRIKRVPDPVAYLGSIKGDGMMTKTELNATSGVFARMENFDFDLSFQVVSFVMTTNAAGTNTELKANGPALTPEMKLQLKNSKTNDRVIFSQVTVKGPDGTLRKIPGVVVTVK